MLYAQTPPAEKRRLFRERLASGEILRFPGAFNPLSARLIEQKGFEGVYISGAVLSADLGLPDIGLTTLTEVAGRGKQIARMTELPAIIDADTGFGEPMNVARTVQEMEDAGPRRPAHRGPGEPQALRAPRRQAGRRRVDRAAADPRRRRRPPRPELPHHGAHRHPRRRRPGRRGRPREEARRRRRRRDLPRGDGVARRVRRDPRRRRRAAARQHDRVRQERAVHRAAAGRRRHEHRDLAGVAAAPGDGRRRSADSTSSRRPASSRRCSARCSTAPTSTSSSTTRATTSSTPRSSTSASPADAAAAPPAPAPLAARGEDAFGPFAPRRLPVRAPKIVQPAVTVLQPRRRRSAGDPLDERWRRRQVRRRVTSITW